METSGQHHAAATLSPRVRAPGTRCMEGCVGTTAGLEAVVIRIISIFAFDENRNPVVQLVLTVKGLNSGAMS